MKFEQPKWPEIIEPENVVKIATLGPVGMTLPAPGTWGSFAGILFFVVFCWQMNDIELLITSVIVGYAAIGICGRAEIIMGRRDPGEVILDEVVAMPLCLIGWRIIAVPGFFGFVGILLAAFALFRFYDIRKPGVINRLQELPGGWGIVIDDTAAALATCGTLHVAHAVWSLVHPSALL